jgi:pyruvate/2-oxoglutarate dehydrogenase complex dihydrolipoamide dehydrogenase (E3) component
MPAVSSTGAKAALMTEERFDVVVLGGGSAAESLCEALAGDGKRLAVIEADRVGGDCPFVACMPSKALLRSAAIRRLLQDAGPLGASGPPRTGRGRPGLDRDAYRQAVERRDVVAEERHDTAHYSELESSGVTVLRGNGRLAGRDPMTVDVDQGGRTRRLVATDVVIATGSQALLPPIDGLDRVPTWTSDQALTARELPSRLAVLGGGAVGCELAQAFAGFGASVVLLETAPELMAGEEPRVSEALTRQLRRTGVEVRTSTEVMRAEIAPGGATLCFKAGGSTTVERVIVAAGRRPSSDGIGLEALGVGTGEDGAIKVDSRCMVEGVPHLWACGDVTAVAPFTHGAKYQARVVATNLQGHRREADYRAIPRVVYTDPPLAAVGLTEAAATSSGLEVITATMPIGETARAVADWTLLNGEESPGAAAEGCLVLVADREREVLIGASAVGPAADEWISEVSLAILAEVSLSRLRDLVHPFPTYSEALDSPLSELLADGAS